MKYRTICADPPWKAPDPRGWGAGWGSALRRPLPYPAMSVAAIAALPVSEIAEPSGSHLYLWTTNHYLRAAFEVLQAWGFRYAQTLVWAKTPRGKGPGGAFSQNAEFVLFGRRGTLAHKTRLDSVWFNWPRTARHSAKPEHFIDMVETVSPGPYLELFSRRHRLGWDVLGDAMSGKTIQEELDGLASIA